MQAKPVSFPWAAILAVISTLWITVSLARASTEQVLYSFSTDGTDGSRPYSGLVFDIAGNLYGTTALGGAHGCGTVFELSPAGQSWTEKVIYSFQDNNKDGCYPYASLVFDGTGNLYGTTYAGGSQGFGAVFELSPGAKGQWTEKLLRGFSGSGGASPVAGVVFDAAGNLYGTTVAGGTGGPCTGGCGIVFRLTPAKGWWNETVLHDFSGTDGASPYSGVILDASGNVYGTTFAGGEYFAGAVYELTLTGGKWNETVLYSFDNNGVDASAPAASLVFDASGNLYGTTTAGGRFQEGTVFELSPGASGWTETLLHNFDNNGEDGYQPYAGLIFSLAGKLYGTTSWAGSNGGGWGTVFALTDRGSGNWGEHVLHSFDDNGSDGYGPYLGSLVMDAEGHLYGTTAYGGSGSNCGTNGCGTVFEVIP